MTVNLFVFYRVRIDSLTNQKVLKENIRASNGIFRDMTKAPDTPVFKRLFDALEGSQERMERAVYVADEVDFEVVAMGWDEGDWYPLGTRCDNEWHETTPNYPHLMVMWEGDGGDD